MSAVKFSGENHLHLNNIIAARTGKGIKELPSIKGYASSIVVVWRPGGSYNQFLEPTNSGTNVVGRVRFDLERSDWAQLRVLQLLMSDDTAAWQSSRGVARLNSIAPPATTTPTDDFPSSRKALKRPSQATTTIQVWVPIFSTVIVTCRRP